MGLKLKGLMAVIACLALSVISSSPSLAAVSPKPVIVFTVTHDNVTVSSDASGDIYASQNNTLVEVYGGLKKNGVTGLNYINNMFVASSFFSVAYSPDGFNWTESFMPVGAKFDPANIISDDEFFNANTMKVDDIQSLFDSHESACSNGACLKDYKEGTYDRAANLMCDSINGVLNESAASIIYRVSQACGINPQVLIVILQKEQGLVNALAPKASKFKIAMGYACPDNSVCDSTYYGFYNQVYNSAKQFKRYANPVGTTKHYTWFPIGKPTLVGFSPDATCGGSTITIKNQATAGLYYYTPYQPNTASLNAVWKEGDACSSYGNRNFWQYYNSWFNSTKDFKTFIEWNGSNYIAIDGYGDVATSTDLNTWVRQPAVPTNASIQSIHNDAGQVKVLLEDNTVMATNDGINWVASALPQPAPPTVTPKKDKVKIIYIVKNGDFLYRIARKYKTSISNILKWNKNIKNINSIHKGDKIVVGFK